MSGQHIELADDGVELLVRRSGAGEPVVLVHGSWTDADSWAFLAPLLATDHDVVTYDRRGHSRSGRGHAAGGRRRDEDDLAALVEALGLAPVHLVGNSYGGSIILGLAARRPDLVRSIAVHEPPLVSLLTRSAPALAEEVRDLTTSILGQITAGEVEAGTARFMEEVALGPGAWDGLPAELRRTFLGNVGTFVEMLEHPGWDAADVDALADLDVPVLVTDGDQTVRWLREIAEQLGRSLPGARRHTFPGAGHVPHLSHPELLAEAIGSVAARC